MKGKASFFSISSSSEAKICSEYGPNISKIVFIKMSFAYKGPCGFTHTLFLLTVGAFLFVNQFKAALSVT